MDEGFVREVCRTVPPVRSIALVPPAIELAQVAATVLERRVHVGQALPPAADPDRLPAELGGPVHDALDDRVEARDIAAAGEDRDAFHLSSAMLPDRRTGL